MYLVCLIYLYLFSKECQLCSQTGVRHRFPCWAFTSQAQLLQGLLRVFSFIIALRTGTSELALLCDG